MVLGHTVVGDTLVGHASGVGDVIVFLVLPMVVVLAWHVLATRRHPS